MLEHQPSRSDLCPSPEIAAYIDGELSSDAELALDVHLVGCHTCSTELNRQKQFVHALNCSLRDDLELPAGFTKRVIANAESSVGGLRRRGEWLNAAFVVCGLVLFVLFSLGADSGGTVGLFLSGFERGAAVGGLAAHLLYDLSIGGVVILRSVGSQTGMEGAAAVLLFGFFAASAVAFSRILLRSCRT